MQHHINDANYNQSSSTKLSIPKYCILGDSLRKNPNIPSKVKIYFGELDYLSDIYGNIPYTIGELAKMKKVSINTIKKWNQHLCSEAFIKLENERIIICQRI